MAHISGLLEDAADMVGGGPTPPIGPPVALTAEQLIETVRCAERRDTSR